MSSAAPPTPRPLPFLVGLGLTTSATLAIEVLDTRLLSVVTWYSLAFLVIAMGLFGLTAGALKVYLSPAEYEGEALPISLARDTRRAAWGAPIAGVLLLVVPLRSDPVGTTLPLFVFFGLILALPFYPAGAVVAAALTKTSLPVGRVYAVDLIGAALGAPLTAGLLAIGSAPNALLLVGVILALGSAAFAASGSDRTNVRRGLSLALLLGVVALLDQGSSRGLVPLWIKGRPEVRELIADEKWNTHSRVVVSQEVEVPAMYWGRGTRCPIPTVRQRMLEIDGHAATPLYSPQKSLDELRFIECDVTSAVHRLRPSGAIAIIGVGGSRDLQMALISGHAPVVGIELNRRVLDALTGPLGRGTLIPGHKDVVLVHDEARSWLARSQRQFQVVQMSLIDTWAATGAGAHALGENGLYTVDGWRVFLDRLEPGGIFTVSRWATVESVRMVALASAALLGRGVQNPRDHIALIGAGTVTTLLVGRDPLTADDEQKVRDLSAERGFQVIALPHAPPEFDRLEAVLAAHTRADLDRVTLSPFLDFRPPTDDRPFFFNVIRPGALWVPLPEITAGTIEGNLLATRTLGLAFFASAALVTWAIAIPLWRRARPRGRVGTRLFAAFVYFGCIGVGFMLAEIALLQRMSLVLGHPTYSLIVVLASLVLATGIGSLISDRLPLDRSPYCYAFPVVLAALVAGTSLAWPSLASHVVAAPTASRLGFAAGVCSVLGLGLGVAFPAGLRLARRHHEEETPWLWGINGMGSVLASSAAIMVALEWGLGTLGVVSAAFYLALIPCIALLRRA